MDYTTAIGCKLINHHSQLRRSIPSKWQGHLYASFTPDWKELWHKSRSLKDATFMWSTWRNAIAVHSWRFKINPDIDTNCNSCKLGIEETPFYRFYSWPRAQEAWDYAQSIIYHIRRVQPVEGPHTRLNFLQCFFGSSTPRRFTKFRSIWTLLRSSVLWTVWISRNKEFANQ